MSVDKPTIGERIAAYALAKAEGNEREIADTPAEVIATFDALPIGDQDMILNAAVELIDERHQAVRRSMRLQRG